MHADRHPRAALPGRRVVPLVQRARASPSHPRRRAPRAARAGRSHDDARPREPTLDRAGARARRARTGRAHACLLLGRGRDGRGGGAPNSPPVPAAARRDGAHTVCLAGRGVSRRHARRGRRGVLGDVSPPPRQRRRTGRPSDPTARLPLGARTLGRGRARSRAGRGGASARRARPPPRRPHRRAARAGRRRDVGSSGRVPGRSPRARAPPRDALHRGRGGDRLRAHRPDVRE